MIHQRYLDFMCGCRRYLFQYRFFVVDFFSEYLPRTSFQSSFAILCNKFINVTKDGIARHIARTDRLKIK